MIDRILHTNLNIANLCFANQFWILRRARRQKNCALCKISKSFFSWICSCAWTKFLCGLSLRWICYDARMREPNIHISSFPVFLYGPKTTCDMNALPYVFWATHQHCQHLNQDVFAYDKMLLKTFFIIMMTSSNGKIFRVTGHLCGEFTGPWWIPLTKGQWHGALMFSLICVWINDWVNNREAGDLRRYRAHYDVIVIVIPVIHIYLTHRGCMGNDAYMRQ